LVVTLLKGVFMATKDSDRKRQSERPRSMDDDEIIRGRADEMEDKDSESEEFEDIEDMNDEEEEERDGSF
jgi:hypothetical protein